MDQTKQTQGAKGSFRKNCIWDAWLAQSVEHMTLDLGVVNSSPVLGGEPTLRKGKKSCI